MKKGLFISVLILTGMILGFLVGQNVKPIERLKIVKEKVIDTVYKSKIVKVPFEVPVEKKETVPKTDSIEKTVETTEIDSVSITDIEIGEDTLFIKKDEKLRTESLKIIVVKHEEIDTLLQKLLNVEPVKQKQITLEYWESPVNYKGYKLSKTKLIVYGIDPITPSIVYKNESKFYFNANNLFYELVESSEFKSLFSIPKPDFLND